LEHFQESILEPIFLEQLRKSHVLLTEVAHYDRLEPSDPDRSYEFLVRSARRYLERQRFRGNREAIAGALGGNAAKSQAAPAAPAAKGRDGKKGGKKGAKSRSPSPARKPKSSEPNVCFEFQKSGKCARGDSCIFVHTRDKSRGRSPSPQKDKKKGKGGGKSRSSSPARKDVPCRFYLQGKCTFGNQCSFRHDGKPGGDAAPAHETKGSNRRGRSRQKKGGRSASPAAVCVMASAAPEASKSHRTTGPCPLSSAIHDHSC
jgi:hypothetical protein